MPNDDGDISKNTAPPMAKKATANAAWMGMSQLYKTLAMLVAIPVIARLLLPSDFGIVAMAAPVIAFLVLFQDLGLSQSIVQSKHINQDQITTLFYVNIIASLIVSIFLLVISPLAAIFYNDDRAGHIIAASSLTVIISGASLVHIALMSRSMRFRSLALIECAATTVNFAVIIGGAFYLRSYWAIWLAMLASAVTQSILLWSVNHWRPSVTFDLRRVAGMLKFGRGVAGFNIVNFLVRNLDNVLIGRFLGAVSLGFYDQCYKLMMGPMQAVNGPLSRVMLPVLAKLSDSPFRYRRAFLMASRALLFALTPGLVVVAATSRDLLIIILGPNWEAAAGIFFWLSLTGILQPLPNATGWLFITSGRTHEMFLWGLWSGLFTAAGFWVGLRWGAEGIAASLFCTLILRIPILFLYCTKGTAVSSSDLFKLTLEPILVCAIAFLIIAGLRPYVSFQALFVVGLVASYSLMILTTLLSRAGREFSFAIVQSAKQFLGRI